MPMRRRRLEQVLLPGWRYQKYKSNTGIEIEILISQSVNDNGWTTANVLRFIEQHLH